MVNIVYPTLPDGVDYQGIMGATSRGYKSGKDWRDEKDANAAFGQYLGNLYGQPAQPQTLASLGQPNAPQPNSIQRSPLAPPMDPATARVEQAFAAQGQGRGSLDGNQIAGRFLKTVRDGGVTNPYALAAIAATGKAESGFSPQNATRTWSDPSQSGQAGTAGGIMSWRGPRLAALQRFAQQNGDDPNAPTPETQGKFLLAEDPSLIQKLQQAGSPEEAQQIMNNAWRFAGYDQPGGEAAARIQSAQAYAPQFGGQAPSQQALEGLAVGGSVPMGAPQGQPVQVADASGAAMPQPAPQAQQGGSILPPREVMQALFKSPGTRPLAIQLAQAAQGLSIDANDPMKKLQYQKALLELQALSAPKRPEAFTLSPGQVRYGPNGEVLAEGPPKQPTNGITIGADGTVQIGGNQKLTEGQSKDLVFYTRGLDAESQLSQRDTQLADFGQKNADLIPLGIGNYLRTPAYRQAKQAADGFLLAILRKDTGAAITDKEFEQYGPQFLPIPGDDAGTIEQKRRARQVALLAIRSGLGTAEAVAKANEMTLGLDAPNPGKSARVPAKNKTSSGIEWSVE